MRSSSRSVPSPRPTCRCSSWDRPGPAKRWWRGSSTSSAAGSTTHSRRSIARRCPTPCSNRRSSVTNAAPLRAPTSESQAGSSWPTTARCFSTKLRPLSAGQAKLLRVVEEHRVERLGSRQSTEVDFRSSAPPIGRWRRWVGDATFREDLYYRINAFTIRLRHCGSARLTSRLADRFLSRYCAAQGLRWMRAAGSGPTELLMAYPGPATSVSWKRRSPRGALCPRGYVHATDLQFLHPALATGKSSMPALSPLRDVERDHIMRVLTAVNWNRSGGRGAADQSRDPLPQDRRVPAGEGRSHA